MPTALIQPNFDFVKEWGKRHQLSFDSIEALTSSEKVKERIQEEVDNCNINFGKWERIKRFELTPEEWGINSGHLTPTMKMKRKVIKEIYKDLYEKMYDRS